MALNPDPPLGRHPQTSSSRGGGLVADDVNDLAVRLPGVDPAAVRHLGCPAVPLFGNLVVEDRGAPGTDVPAHGRLLAEADVLGVHRHQLEPLRLRIHMVELIRASRGRRAGEFNDGMVKTIPHHYAVHSLHCPQFFRWWSYLLFLWDHQNSVQQ